MSYAHAFLSAVAGGSILFIPFYRPAQAVAAVAD